MESISDHWVETLTGIAATGVEILLCHTGSHPVQGHPMLPLLQITADDHVSSLYGEDLDLILEDQAPDAWADRLLQLLVDVAARQYRPKLTGRGNTDFQITRGLLGVSM